MALPLALVALVVIAALIAVGFAVALLEQRIGRNALFAVQASGAAQAGVAAVVDRWDDHGLGLLAPGDSAVLTAASLAGRTAYRPTVTRLNGELYQVRVEGMRLDADGGELARRDLTLLVRRADTTVPGFSPVRPLANRAWTGLF